MASRQSEAVAELYRTWVTEPTQHPDWTPEDQRDLVEVSWGTLTSEPGGVDYIEVDAGGVPGMWLNPKDAAADRVLFAVHGGGFMSGSIFTHRKLFAHLAKAVPARALTMNYRLIQSRSTRCSPPTVGSSTRESTRTVSRSWGTRQGATCRSPLS